MTAIHPELLIHAIEENDIDRVIKLINKGVDMNYIDEIMEIINLTVFIIIIKTVKKPIFHSVKDNILSISILMKYIKCIYF